jgi:hypothetical protein
MAFALFRNSKFLIPNTTSSRLSSFSNTFLIVAGRFLLLSSLHIFLFAGELPPVLTSISLAEFHSIKMSFINQSTTQSQQPAHGRTGNAPRQAQTAVQRKPSGLQHAQAIMHHHVEGLVVSYLEQNPNLFAGLLQRHEIFLAQYLHAHYNIALPTRKGLHCPAPSHHTAEADAVVANPQSKASLLANLPTSRTTNYQRPSAKISQTVNYKQPSVENGDSPQSTSSQLSSTWPTEEDLNVPYPAPKQYLDREAGLNKGKGYKWTFEEQDLAIEHMFVMRDDPTVPRTEKRFELVSRLFMEQYGIERSKDSVKNMWNRIGRQRSQYDERKNKSAPLATSQQGKQARMDQEAKRNGKRKVSAEPEQSVQKKSKPSSMRNDLVSDAHDWSSMSSQEMAKANVSLDASLDALFSDQDGQALPQYVDMSEFLNTGQTQPRMSSHQGRPPTSVSAAFPEVPPTNAVSQIQTPASGTQDVPPTTASPVFPDLPTLMTQLEEDPRADAHYTSDEEFAKMMMAEMGTETGVDDLGPTDGFFNAYTY